MDPFCPVSVSYTGQCKNQGMSSVHPSLLQLIPYLCFGSSTVWNIWSISWSGKEFSSASQMHLLLSVLHVFPQSMPISSFTFTSRKNTTYFLQLQRNLDVVLLGLQCGHWIVTVETQQNGWVQCVLVMSCLTWRVLAPRLELFVSEELEFVQGTPPSLPPSPPQWFIREGRILIVCFTLFFCFQEPKMGNDQGGCF